MKKLLIIMLACLCLCGCNVVDEPIESAEPVTYIVAGNYYTSGDVITEDGNVWGYSQDIISEAPSHDNQPVYVLMYDAGTPDNIYDDEVVGLVSR